MAEFLILISLTVFQLMNYESFSLLGEMNVIVNHFILKDANTQSETN